MATTKKNEATWVEEWKNTWINPSDKMIIADNQSKPVDVLGLSKKLGAKVYVPYMDTSLEGWIEYNQEEDSYEIYINPQYPALKQRFTLAHEISHLLFHKKEIKEYGQLDRGYSSKGFFDVKEWQANTFASEILVPTELIHEDINNDSSLLYETILTQYIAKEYKVSSRVALKRAKRALITFREDVY